MKFSIPFLTALTFATPSFAASDVYIPENACLREISESVAAVGTSANSAENQIDFENVLSIRGQQWKILYYKALPEDRSNLGIEGKAIVNLEILKTVREGRYVLVQECSVKSARILREKRN